MDSWLAGGNNAKYYLGCHCLNLKTMPRRHQIEAELIQYTKTEEKV